MLERFVAISDDFVSAIVPFSRVPRRQVANTHVQEEKGVQDGRSTATVTVSFESMRLVGCQLDCFYPRVGNLLWSYIAKKVFEP